MHSLALWLSDQGLGYKIVTQIENLSLAALCISAKPSQNDGSVFLMIVEWKACSHAQEVLHTHVAQQQKYTLQISTQTQDTISPLIGPTFATEVSTAASTPQAAQTLSIKSDVPARKVNCWNKSPSQYSQHKHSSNNAPNAQDTMEYTYLSSFSPVFTFTLECKK